MADLTVTKARVAPVFPLKSEIYDLIASETISAGQAVYVTAAGKAGVAGGAGVSPVNRFRGIALNDAGAGQAVSVLVKGAVAGFDLSGVAYDGIVYVSNTLGALGDVAGTTSLAVGKVMPLTDKDLTKILMVTGWAG